VNVTPPISGAVAAQGSSPVLPKNSSLADLLFADSPANAASDFRAIAATLFGLESSAQTQSPTNSAPPGNKPAAILPEEKPDTRKGKEVSDPAFAGVAAELLVPPQTVPVPLIPTPPKLDSSAEKQVNSDVSEAATPLGLGGIPGQLQINSTAKQAEAREDHILPSAFGDQEASPVQPATENTLTSGKQIAAPIAAPATGATRKKDVEPAKPPTDRPQPLAIPQDSKQPSPSAATVDRARQSTDSNFSGGPSEGQEKPPVATDALPPVPPVEQTLNAPADKVLDSVGAENAAPQSALIPPTAVAGSRNTSNRSSSSSPVKMKGRDVKDSRTMPGQSAKPGFIPTSQALGGSNVGGSGKDSPGFPLSGNSGAHGKPAPVKLSTDGPSPASLADADGPDETLPTSSSLPVTAKLVQGMSQSEFRVGMQSQEFGNIDIRTSVARHMFSAQISVEHSDVAKSLTAQLPGLYHRLADQQVAVGNIVIHGQDLGTSSGLAQDAQAQSRQPQGHGADVGTAKLNAEPILPVMSSGIDSAGRLDIRI
jgi:flagellar hook-length control protein FliK